MSEQHTPHQHKPRNINEVHDQERFGRANAYHRANEQAAVWMTRLFSTMELFWIIDLFMAVWIIGNSIGTWHFDPLPYPLLLMIINIPQLPLLPLLAIGQSVLSRKAELQADEQYATTKKLYADVETIIAQNNQLLELLKKGE